MATPLLFSATVCRKVPEVVSKKATKPVGVPLPVATALTVAFSVVVVPLVVEVSAVVVALGPTTKVVALVDRSARADDEGIADAVAGDVVAETAVDDLVDFAGVLQGQRQSAGAADRLRCGRGEVERNRAVELREVQGVDDIAGRRVDGVAAEVARVAGELEGGAAAAGHQRIVAAAGDERHRAAAADQRIAAAAAFQHVADRVAVDGVAAARRADHVVELTDQRKVMLLVTGCIWLVVGATPVEALLRSRVMPPVTPGKRIVLIPELR